MENYFRQQTILVLLTLLDLILSAIAMQYSAPIGLIGAGLTLLNVGINGD
jgi:hypothetical protein